MIDPKNRSCEDPLRDIQKEEECVDGKKKKHNVKICFVGDRLEGNFDRDTIRSLSQNLKLGNPITVVTEDRIYQINPNNVLFISYDSAFDR